VTLGNDGAVCLGQLPLAFKNRKAPKNEIDIMHPHFIFFFFFPILRLFMCT